MSVLKKPHLLFSEEAMMEDNVDDIDEGVTDSESASESEEVALTEASKDSVNNKEGLLEKLEDIVWPENEDWIHKLSIDHDLPEQVDVNVGT